MWLYSLRYRGKLITAMLFFLTASSVLAFSSIEYLRRFDFNNEQALNKWASMIIKGKTDYRLVMDGDNGYVEALSEGSSSALYYKIFFNLEEYPFLSWRWKALKFPDKTAAVSDKDRDDYVARVYVIFPFLTFSSSKFIEYVWSDDLPVGTVMPSPHGDNIRLIVVRCGKPETPQWFDQQRDVYKDYVMAFGQKPSLKVGAIAMMCDADGTKTEAESLFDDIMIENRAGIKRRIGEDDQDKTKAIPGQ